MLKKLILRRLIRSNTWGGKHTPVDFVMKGIPEYYRNTNKGKKLIEKALKKLVNDELVIILIKKTGKGSGSHISLNPRKVREIREIIGEE